MMNERTYDVIVYGATGFTGRLVAEYMAETYPGGDVKWAIAGRSRDRLEALRGELNLSAPPDIVLADAAAPETLAAMAASTRVVLTTVGPYQLYGTPLVEACVAAGADYVDLCGEPGWMADMIARFDAPARASGARIVFSCGFDSIPFDLGVLFLQHTAIRRFGAPCPRVRGRVRKMQGGFSGGTAASLLATLEASVRDPSLMKRLADPFLLAPGFRGPPQPAEGGAVHDPVVSSWTAPFIMATINTKNVHRTNALLGNLYGQDFVYDERMMTGDGPKGKQRAMAAARQESVQSALLALAPTRALIRRFVLPKPGQGPSKEQRENGFYDVLFAGETASGDRLRVSVSGRKDPGYGSTSRMIAEAAMCLARDVDRASTRGGVWTPGAALGSRLIGRLEASAGLTFQVEDPA
jgi:short subunit dehydrogenase-like uncharacterized protein